MTFRKIDTEMWQDPWFEQLEPEDKLAFIYLWTNPYCNQAGIYEISSRRVSFDIGYHIDTISIPLSEKVIWYPDRKIIWVKNFFRHQCQNGKFAIAALKSIKDDKYKLQIFINHNRKFLEDLNVNLKPYHIDTLSIPYPTDQIRSEQNRDLSSKEDKSKQPPSEAADADTISSNTIDDSKKESGHFRSMVGSHFKVIKESCEAILKLPQKRNSQFNPYQFVQKHVNEGRHPGAIAETLKAMSVPKNFKGIKGDPFAYGNSILKTKNQNWNEKETIKIHEELKQISIPELKELTEGMLKII